MTHFRFILVIGASVFIPLASVSAHVVVKPSEAGVGSFQTFTTGVPNEKDNPTVGLRLVIPEGLEHVTPNVKPGWNIDIKREGEGEAAKVSEISWTGGSIPADQRDDFIFSAKVPSSEAKLTWKAYQTYQNGEVVAWDQTPDNGDPEHPFSQTKVINDLTSESGQSLDQIAFLLSIVAVLGAGAALFYRRPAQ